MKLVNCGCGGKAEFGKEYYGYQVKCSQCGTTGPWKMKEEDAILGWNQAMSGFVKDKNVRSKVPERKKGEWIEYPDCLRYEGAYNDDHIVCSECGHVFSICNNCTEEFDFCPHCGADMRGEYE